MASAKSATGAPKAAPKPRAVPAPSLKPATVVVPAVSVLSPPQAAPMMAKNADDLAHMLKKQEFLERVVKASGSPQKDVKLILEAALGVLGDALSAGEEVNLPPLGKVKVNHHKAEGGAEVLILKLRRGGGKSGGAVAPKQGLAEGDEDD